MALTPKQKLFVEAYVGPADFNSTEAYVLAGYGSRGHGKKRGYQILNTPSVANAINERLESKKKTFRIREDEILEGIYKEATNEAARPSERIQAWVQLGKHLGMFREKEKEKDTNITYNILNYNTKNKEIEENTRKALESKDFEIVE